MNNYGARKSDVAEHEGIQDVTYIFGIQSYAACIDPDAREKTNIGIYPTLEMARTERLRAINNLPYQKGVKINGNVLKKGMESLTNQDIDTFEMNKKRIEKANSQKGDYQGIRDVSAEYPSGKHFSANIESSGKAICIGVYPTARLAAQNLNKAKNKRKYLGGERSLLNDVNNFPGIRDVSKKYKTGNHYAVYIQKNAKSVYIGVYGTLMEAVKKQQEAENRFLSESNKQSQKISNKKEAKSDTGYPGIKEISFSKGSGNKIFPTYEVTYRDSKTKRGKYLGRFATLESAVDSQRKASLGKYIKPESLPNKYVLKTRYADITDVSYQYPAETGRHFYVRLMYRKHLYNIGVFGNLEEGYRIQQQVKKMFDSIVNKNDRDHMERSF